jgi:hypothetical protein
MRVFLLLIAMGLLALPALGRSDRSETSYVASEVHEAGPALFYRVTGEQRTELWAVDCTAPLRGCVARAPGLTLRVAPDLSVWALAAASASARISVQHRNYTRDAPDLFFRPLAFDEIAELSRPNSFILIEDGATHLRISTQGLGQVASYLRWVQSPTAHTLRDARLWPKGGALQEDAMSPEVLERYEILQRRQTEALRQQVPRTKPQIEFAIQAQGGRSFFEPQGRDGY